MLPNWKKIEILNQKLITLSFFLRTFSFNSYNKLCSYILTSREMLKFCLYEPCLNMKHTLGSTEAVTLQPRFGTVTSSLRKRVTTASVFSTLSTRACTNLYSCNQSETRLHYHWIFRQKKITGWPWSFTLMSSKATSLVGNSFHCPSGCFCFITGSLAWFLDAQCGMAMAKGSSNCKVLIRLN